MYGADTIDLVVVPPRQPQPISVGADVAHVETAATADRPLGDHLAGCQIGHGDAVGAVARAEISRLLRARIVIGPRWSVSPERQPHRDSYLSEI